MQLQRTFTFLAVAAASTGAFAGSARAANVGNNPGGPSTVLIVNSGPFGGPPPSFLLLANVTHDPAAGNLLKDFTNTSQGGGGPASGIPSGQNVPIDETFVNTGTDAWVAWTERVVTRSEPFGFDPGFLFDDVTPVTVMRNGLTLTAGVDYTLSTTFNGPPGNNGYEEIMVNLAPSSYIQPGDSLNIQKQIHEVFGDGNVWALNEVARVAQYPTVPEPAGLTLLAMGGFTTTMLRRRRRS